MQLRNLPVSSRISRLRLLEKKNIHDFNDYNLRADFQKYILHFNFVYVFKGTSKGLFCNRLLVGAKSGKDDNISKNAYFGKTQNYCKTKFWKKKFKIKCINVFAGFLEKF